MASQPPRSGFISALFDFSFSAFITTKLIPIIYGLGLAAAGLGTLGFVVGTFTQGTGVGMLVLILSPLIFLFAAMYLRVMLEVMIVLFRISENVHRIAERPSGA